MLQSRPMRPTLQPMMSPAEPRRTLGKSWLMVFPCLLLVACTATSPLIPVGEGPVGTVALERLISRGTTARYGSPQSAFQASHPATVSAAVVSRLLSGLSISGLDRPGGALKQERFPLFSQEETEFLTPLIVRALSQAGPDQRVRFTLQDDGLLTEGTLYLHKTTLRVSLSHYRASQGQSDTRPAALTLSFTPSDALVPRYRERSLILGRRVVVAPTGAGAFEGIAADITDDGSLVVRHENGRHETVTAADVSVRPA